MLEPNCRSHGCSRLKRDLRNSFRLCVHFKSHLNAGASRPTHTPTHVCGAHTHSHAYVYRGSPLSVSFMRAATALKRGRRWRKLMAKVSIWWPHGTYATMWPNYIPRVPACVSRVCAHAMTDFMIGTGGIEYIHIYVYVCRIWHRSFLRRMWGKRYDCVTFIIIDSTCNFSDTSTEREKLTTIKHTSSLNKKFDLELFPCIDFRSKRMTIHNPWIFLSINLIIYEIHFRDTIFHKIKISILKYILSYDNKKQYTIDRI